MSERDAMLEELDNLLYEQDLLLEAIADLRAERIGLDEEEAAMLVELNELSRLVQILEERIPY